MKYKVLIAAQSLEIGGAERSLVSLLNSLDYSRVEVDLFLCRHMGEFMKYLPKEVNLLPEDPNASMLANPFSMLLKKHRFRMMYGRLYSKWKTMRFNRKHHYSANSSVEIEYSHRYTYNYIDPIMPQKVYDYAISFLTPHYIVANKVLAKRKAAWIHTDYSSIEIDIESENRMWRQYDDIISISESCTEGFAKVFPELAGRIVLIENVLDAGMIRREAGEKDARKELGIAEDELCLCTVGRFSDPKNMECIPGFCRMLLNRGIKLRWLLVGYGSKESLIRENIKKYHVEKEVLVVGKQNNPYPYMDACDVYVQPSSYEGKSVTVREAQILGKTVVITNYPTSSNQLEDGVDGMIFPLEKEAFVNQLYFLLLDSKKRKQLQENCEKREYSNKSGVDVLYQLMECMSNQTRCMVSVFTATYNRLAYLPRLYESLQKQTNRNFEWIIYDDGSDDGTEEYFRRLLAIHKDDFPIQYLKGNHRGKHVGINCGVKVAKGRLFFCVDSDDYLTEDAIDKLVQMEDSLSEKEKVTFAGVSGDCLIVDGVDKSDYGEARYIDCLNWERDKKGIVGDKAEALYTQVMKRYPFPVFPNEIFCIESVVWNRIARDEQKIRYFPDKICVCQYLEGGLTARIPKIFSENLKGLEVLTKEMPEGISGRGKFRNICLYTYYARCNGIRPGGIRDSLQVRAGVLLIAELVTMIYHGGIARKTYRIE